MKLIRSLTLGAALLTTSAWAFGQGYYSPAQFHDRDDRAAYRDGYQQGQMDARNHRGFRPDANRYREGDDRRAFRDGYEAGYRSRGGHDWIAIATMAPTTTTVDITADEGTAT